MTLSHRLETILVKNLSLEIPENVVSPTFSQKPEIQLELRSKTRPLNRDDYYEVQLEATARVKNGDALQVLIELQQAGIFYLEEPDRDKRQEFLGIQAPTILYPYFTQLMSDLLAHAGAPRIFLPPFDFKPAYEKKQEILREKLAQDDRDGKILS